MWNAENGRSKATIDAYRSDLKGLVAFADEQLGFRDDAQTVATYVTTMRDDWAIRTTNRRITVFTAYGNWLGTSFLADYRKRRPAPGEADTLRGGMSDVAALAHHARREGNVNLMALIALCGMMAMRVGGARSVRAEDIDFDAMTVSYVQKGGHEGLLPIPESAVSLLTPAVERCEAPEDRLVQLSMSACGRSVKRAGRLALMDQDIHTHQLRATKLTHMARNGIDVGVIQNVAGHADPRTTEIYTRSTVEDMRAAINA